MSTTLRILLHDEGRNSHALLAQLGALTTISWLDSAGPINPNNLAPTMGLAYSQITAVDGDGTFAPSWMPHLGEIHPWAGKQLQFTRWWNSPVVRDGSRTDFSRKDLVLAVANSDGGGHVDPSLRPAYLKLSRLNSMGMGFTGPKNEGDFGDPILANIRQIGFEVLASLPQDLL